MTSHNGMGKNGMPDFRLEPFPICIHKLANRKSMSGDAREIVEGETPPVTGEKNTISFNQNDILYDILVKTFCLSGLSHSSCSCFSLMDDSRAGELLRGFQIFVFL